MTVLRVNTAEEHAFPRYRNAYGAAGQRGGMPSPASPQVQSWARGLEAASGRQRSVIAGTRAPMPVLSSRGIRQDALAVVVTVLLAVFLIVLIADVTALHSNDTQIVRLSSTIESLESGNEVLRNRLSTALRHPVLVRAALEDGEPIDEQVVFLSPAPEQ